jgi:hypothetical protein
MALYRSLDITCGNDIYHVLSGGAAQGQQQLQEFYLYNPLVMTKPPPDVREALSAKETWTHCSDANDNLNESLKALRLEWIDAMYSALHSMLASPQAQSFHILGDDLYPSAYFMRTEKQEDICMLGGVTNEIIDRLISYGANPKILNFRDTDIAVSMYIMNRLHEGQAVICYSRLAVFAAAAVLVDIIAPPLKTLRHYVKVPKIVSSVSFLHSSSKRLYWQDLSINSNNNSMHKRFRFKVTGYIFPEMLKSLLEMIQEANHGSLLFQESRPLTVVNSAHHDFSSSHSAELDEPSQVYSTQTTQPVKRKLKNPFVVVRSVSKPLEEVTQKSKITTASVSLGAEYDQGALCIKCSVEEHALVFCYVESALRSIVHELFTNPSCTPELNLANGLAIDTGSRVLITEALWSEASFSFKFTHVELPTAFVQNIIKNKDNLAEENNSRS